MGTHPIFESDFDCLTDLRAKMENENDSSDSASEIDEVDLERIVTQTKRRLDRTSNSERGSDSSGPGGSSSSSDASSSDDADENESPDESTAEGEKELVRKVLPFLADDPFSAELPNLAQQKEQFQFRLPRLVRKRTIGQRRRQEVHLRAQIYRDAVGHFHPDGMRQLAGHHGCVNALGWSTNGERLVSGSDDLHLCVWNPEEKTQTPKLRFRTGHRQNIFQTKFLPHSSDRTIVTTSRDGEVRLTILDNCGAPIPFDETNPTRVLAKHDASAHKLCFIPQTQVILSCGEDGKVFRIDPRIPETSQETILCKRGLEYSPLYTIDTSLAEPQFAVAGQNPKAYIYDLRKVTKTIDEPVKTLQPESAAFSSGRDENSGPNITCLKYDFSGRRVLCSYNDDDIYLFGVEGKVDQTYRGHRNNQTIKGVNFYGNRSEYVLSGSDCGHFYIWDTKQGTLVNSQYADGDAEFGSNPSMMEEGVVNVLEPAPQTPFLATSGLDHTVKLWSPTTKHFLSDSDAIKRTRSRITANHRRRYQDQNQEVDIQHWTSIIQMLQRHQRNGARRRDQRAANPTAPDELVASLNDDSSDDSSTPGADCRSM